LREDSSGPRSNVGRDRGTWLDELLADPNASGAWLYHLAALVGHAAAVTPAAAPGLPHRVSWTLASGWRLAVLVTVGRAPDGAQTVELGVEAALDTNHMLSGALELTATLTRITLIRTA
jgi:hypothetical protein